MQYVLWVSIYVCIEEKEGVYLSYKNIGPISTTPIYLLPLIWFVWRRTRFSGMERNLGYLTAGRPPALDLDLTLFISTWKVFMCGCKRHNSKRGSFGQASVRKFSQSEWKKWVMKSLLFSLIFEIVLSSKKYLPILFIGCHFVFLKNIYSTWILDSILIHLIRWFFFVRNFWIFVYEKFLILLNVIVLNLGLPVCNLEKY